MKKTIMLLAAVSLLVWMTGCATVFKGSYSKVKFESEPAGAEVYVNGEYQGKTPVKAKLLASESQHVQVKKEGFQSYTRVIDNHVKKGYLILDVVLFGFPAIIDAATQAWYDLDEKHVKVKLEKTNS